MFFTKLVKAATFGFVAAFALTLGGTDGMAQGKDKGGKPAAPAGQQAAAGEQGPPPDIWYKLCIDVPVAEPTKPGEQPKPQKPEEMKKVNVCLTQVDVRDTQTAILVSKIAIRQVQGQDKPQILAMLPLGAALPAGALVRIDEKEPIKLAYTTCDQAGCYAEASVEPAVLEQIKTGKSIEYLGIDVSGRMPKFKLPLDGFAKAIDGQPMPVEKFTEEQRRIAEVIRQRLTDLRKQQEEALKAQQAGGAAPGAGAAAAKPADPKKK
jgi:invasion protein IalB